MSLVDVNVQNEDLLAYFRRLHVRMSDMTPVNRTIAEVLKSGIEQAFIDERDPETGARWKQLSPFTIAARQLAGNWPGQILHQSGRLASSFNPDFGPNFAAAGTNLIYAAIQNFGGTIRPKQKKALSFGGRLVSKAVIPARQFAAISDDGASDILEILGRYALEEPR